MKLLRLERYDWMKTAWKTLRATAVVGIVAAAAYEPSQLREFGLVPLAYAAVDFLKHGTVLSEYDVTKVLNHFLGREERPGK